MKILTLSVVLCVASPATAEPLTLDEVLSAVERSFPLLQSAELEQSLAASERLGAEGAFDVSWKTKAGVNPVGYYDALRADTLVEVPTSLWGASAYAGWKLGTGKFPVYDGKFETLEYGELRAGVSVPLWRNGPIDRRRASLGRAVLGEQIAKLNVDEQRIQYLRAAAHRYWAWVGAGRKVVIARQLLDIATQRDAGLLERVEHGDLPPIERTDNARAIAQRRAQLATAQRGFEQAAIELRLFLRDTEGRPQSLSPERVPELSTPLRTPSLGLDDQTRLALTRRPEAARLELQRQQQILERDWAQNQMVPGIDFQVGGSYDLGRKRPDRKDLSQPVLELQLSLDLPVQTRQMRARAEVATATLQRLDLQRSFARDRIQADVHDATSAVVAATDRIEATRQEVGLAVELQGAEQLRFDQGDSNLLVVNLREQQTAEAQLREVDAIIDYHRAAADLRAAKGDGARP